MALKCLRASCRASRSRDDVRESDRDLLRGGGRLRPNSSYICRGGERSRPRPLERDRRRVHEEARRDGVPRLALVAVHVQELARGHAEVRLAAAAAQQRRRHDVGHARGAQPVARAPAVRGLVDEGVERDLVRPQARVEQEVRAEQHVVGELVALRAVAARRDLEHEAREAGAGHEHAAAAVPRDDALELVRRVGFSYLHVFPYSRRSSTSAAKRWEELPDHVVHERGRYARGVDRELRRNYEDRFIGTTASVLFEDARTPQTGRLKGYSENYLPIESDADDGLAGRIARVRIRGREGKRLVGDLEGRRP